MTPLPGTNDGAQSFTGHVIASSEGTNVPAIDVDGDSDVDTLSVESDNTDTIAWYENDGSQSFTRRVISNSANGARWVHPIDVDGDGDPTPNPSPRPTVLCTSVAFSERVITNSADAAWSVYAIDVDGDGDVDALSASRRDDKVAWYENDGSESFTESGITNSADTAKSAYAIDLDGDGDMDVLSASMNDDTSGGTVAWYENDGTQSFVEHVITNSADRATYVFAIDVDGDGDRCANAATERVITNSADGANFVYAIDVGGDGDVDPMSASLSDDTIARDDTIAWYENDGAQSFTERIITTLANGAHAVFPIDVDGDGDVDALSASSVSDTVAWHENDGSQSFTERVISNAADYRLAVR
ncbi:hypothetical protein JL720_16319 [Aureococcus anophagefferens]|nr:hypothetical protein JL720_16319 [Aureococcus anophagefferens]